MENRELAWQGLNPVCQDSRECLPSRTSRNEHLCHTVLLVQQGYSQGYCTENNKRVCYRSDEEGPRNFLKDFLQSLCDLLPSAQFHLANIIQYMKSVEESLEAMYHSKIFPPFPVFPAIVFRGTQRIQRSTWRAERRHAFFLPFTASV